MEAGAGSGGGGCFGVVYTWTHGSLSAWRCWGEAVVLVGAEDDPRPEVRAGGGPGQGRAVGCVFRYRRRGGEEGPAGY